MNTYRIAALPGDGIGKEVMPVALKVLYTLSEAFGTFKLEVGQYPWGCEHYLETGVIMPPDGIDILRQYDAIYFVAAGHPDVTDYRSAWEFIFIMRKDFKQYVNVRPIVSYPGVKTLLATDEPIDFVIVRENSEGEYAGPGGIVHPNNSNGVAIQTSVFTREGVERIARYAFKLARERRGRVTNVTKSNAMRHSLVFWDNVIAQVAKEFPDVEYSIMYVDAATMKFIQRPSFFDVIVTTNLFGDVLSDLGGAMVGSVGLSASGNINPEREFPSMYEPVHGSAPDIAGKGIANPVGTILSGALMLKDLGQSAAAELLRKAVAAALADGFQTGDLGGSASTQEMGDAICDRIIKLHQQPSGQTQ